MYRVSKQFGVLITISFRQPRRVLKTWTKLKLNKLQFIQREEIKFDSFVRTKFAQIRSDLKIMTTSNLNASSFFYLSCFLVSSNWVKFSDSKMIILNIHLQSFLRVSSFSLKFPVKRVTVSTAARAWIVTHTKNQHGAAEDHGSSDLRLCFVAI